MKIDKELLLEIKNYIESTEETIDGEWGNCRTKQELIKQDLMPEIYDKIVLLLKEFE